MGSQEDDERALVQGHNRGRWKIEILRIVELLQIYKQHENQPGALAFLEEFEPNS